MYDVVVIGAGVTGSACAMELMKYNLKLAVLEKEVDVCCQTSKANSGIVHAGYDAKTGTMKAKMNVRGAKMMPELCKRLDIAYRNNGSFVVSNSEEGREALTRLLEQGLENGVEGLCIVEGEGLRELEPNISKDAVCALYAPMAGIVCPFDLNIAMAENAAENGAEFYFESEVTDIRKLEEGFCIYTTKGKYDTHCIINAAGVYADEIHNMVSKHKIHITARKGEYCLLDKAAGNHVDRTIFSLPTKAGKGVLVAPTVHGNLLVGPNATDISDKEGTNTTGEGLSEVVEKSARHVVNIPLRQVITSFAGLRAREDGDDFILQEARDVRGFYDCAGIESPGLTSAPAIGEYMAQLIVNALELEKKEEYVDTRKGVTRVNELTFEERKELIKEKPEFGNIVCRCEGISEGEILEAIHRPLGATTIDGIKRRTRAGMGRCQAGFCLPKTMEILARERKMELKDVRKTSGVSTYVTGNNKEAAR